MSILSDSEIIALCSGDDPMITPFQSRQIKEVIASGSIIKTISRGLSSFGYDVTLSDEVKIFSNVNATIVDPKNFQDDCLVDGIIYEDHTGRFVILPPNSYLLGSTVETFHIPRDVMVVAVGKSTYARTGVLSNTTPIESGFKGTVVIEIANATPLPVKIYVNEGIAQFLFFQGNQPCAVSYSDREGKYQGQTGITYSKV